MSDPEKFDGLLLNMATQHEGGVPESSPGKKYRGYSLADLTKAYIAVKEKNFAVQKAAHKFGVPESTLRDRVKGKIMPHKTRSGPAPVLGHQEEERLVEYLQLLSDFGYGYSRTDIINIATEYAILLGKREPTDSFTHQWYYNFLSRWPNIDIRRPNSSRKQMERAVDLDNMARYYQQLQALLKKHNLMNKPDSIFVVDEILLDLDKTPPCIFSWKVLLKYEYSKKKTDTEMTLLAAGNATGARLPAFFIFPGKTVSSESIEDCSPGTGATCSDDGKTNSNVFQLYLDNHFLKFIERKQENEPIILMYDGHRTHISPMLIEMYKAQNVHLFPIPAYASQALTSLDMTLFGDFEAQFNDEADYFIETELNRSIHSGVCVVASKAHNASVCADTLKSLFKRSGVWPFNPQIVDKKVDIKHAQTVTRKTNIPDKKLNVVVTPIALRSRRHKKKKFDSDDEDTENFEQVESEPFKGKRGRKKGVVQKKPYNYSNRRKSSTPRKPKHENQQMDLQQHRQSTSGKTLRFKVELVSEASENKQKPRSRRKRPHDVLMEDSTEEESEDSDSELDEMLSSGDEHDDGDIDQDPEDFEHARRVAEFENAEREDFENALREELLNTRKIYFEGTQRERFERAFEKAHKSHEHGDNEVTTTEVVTIEEQIIDVPGESKQYIIDMNDQDVEQTVTVESSAVDVIVESFKGSRQESTSSSQVKTENVEEEIPMSEKCCVCKQYHPEKAADGYVTEFATWGKCEYPDCEHWTHLKYCCNVKVLRRHDTFHCPCHFNP